MGLEVYLDPCTINSHKVLAGLEYLKVPYNLHEMDYFGGDHKKEDFKKINPYQTVPAAVDDDLHLGESNAILQYAADDAGAAYPKDVKVRAKINAWLLWETSAWFPACYPFVIENVAKPLLKAPIDHEALKAATPRLEQLCAVLNNEFGQHKYIVGENLTIADIAIASPMHMAEASKIPLDKYPNLKRWYGDIKKEPSWQKTQVAVDKKFGLGVRANFNYTKDVKELTEIYFYDHELADKVHAPGDAAHEMEVHDGWARNASQPFSAEVEGFAVHDFTTPFTAWEDDERVRAEFYPQVVDFLTKAVGAKRILVFDHTIRTKANVAKKITDEANTSQRAPVKLVHCDYTAESGPVRVRQLLENEADELLSRRVAFFNVWKPIRNVVQENPLAMCDVTTSPDADFFKLFLRYRERTGENYVMRHSDAHKWWYFPQMTPEQVILLKTYESESDGRARFVGHTAFDDPTSAPDAPVRESVEIRTIAFF